jgi:predicted transcriptional regulator
MMKEILKLIHEAGVVNYAEIAQTVGVSEVMVQQAIMVLQAKGYLKTVTCNADSSAACPSCSGCHGACKANQQAASTFFVTEKGKKYLNGG